MDASNRQVLYTNQLLPVEENLRTILIHYDQYGFGNGFDLVKPEQIGKFSNSVDLVQAPNAKENKQSLHDKLVKLNEGKIKQEQLGGSVKKTRNVVGESKTFDDKMV